ncbi:MAG: sigma factor-like helix-turn-helix DNA-binding protein, partial [Acidithiobacillus sp.]|nr:sigma factor-like helix-turn-helix DNA-binding protein [Acidithiobacillus sp.]
VHRWMNDLASPQREIVELYFGINPLGPLNNKEIGEIFGFSAQRANKIRKSALDELSKMAFQYDKSSLKEKYF